jgi:hypothetical protein
MARERVNEEAAESVPSRGALRANGLCYRSS